MQVRPLLRTAFTWLVVICGFVLGLLALAWCGSAWVPDDSPKYSQDEVWLVGCAVLALTFFAGSFAAQNNRKRAGLIFLCATPVISFCLGYPSAYLFYCDRTGEWYRTNTFSAFALSLIFFGLIATAWFATRHSKRIFLASAAVIAIAVFGSSAWRRTLAACLAGWAVPTILFALFWLLAARRGWMPLRAPVTRSTCRRILNIAAICIVIVLLDVVVTLAFAAGFSSMFEGDCSRRQPFTHPESPQHAVFTTRVIFAGRSLFALTAEGSLYRNYPRSLFGDWAVGTVQDRFWGIPAWWHFVLLKDALFWRGETYFIDGQTSRGILTRHLAIIHVGGSCSRTAVLSHATLDLRLLHNPKKPSDTRLIGWVHKPVPFQRAFGPPTAPVPLAGAELELSGSSGSTVLKTDAEGVYQIDGLPPGDYSLHLRVPPNQVVGFFHESNPDKIRLVGGAVTERDFELFWNGRIEGHVTDDSGLPAKISVTLINAEGGWLPAYVSGSFEFTSADGFYQIAKIPPGRYSLVLNQDGPDESSPYEIQYYPSGFRAQDAQVFTISEGQEIKNVDVTVHRLPKRDVTFNVVWPDGTRVSRAEIYVAYEHTSHFDAWSPDSLVGTTGDQGTATVHLLGNSRVRVRAQRQVDDPKHPYEQRYSRAVELEIGKMAEPIQLVMMDPDAKRR